MYNHNTMKKIISILEKHTKQFSPPLINIIVKEYGKNPFLILIGCLLSLRTKDTITIHVCRNLFKKAKTPQEILAIKKNDLEKLIYKTGFYKNKSKVLHEVSRVIHEKHLDKVPKNLDQLLSIKGIGRKTANLVLGMAFGKPAICVDTHVHRISNRLGIIKSNNEYETELELEKVIPKNKWILWNKLLVIWGQNVCLPRNPKCPVCPLKTTCPSSAENPT